MRQVETEIAVVVLAAGQGTRLRSMIPKPLHAVGGLPLLGHVLETARSLAPARTVLVVGRGGDAVAAVGRKLAPEIAIVTQPEQKGTGHAVQCAMPALEGFDGRVLVLYADTPFLRRETVRLLTQADAVVAVLGFEAEEPGDYGRLITASDGALERIVEAADATAEERLTRLCNAGVMAFDAAPGRRWLAALRSDNAKGEIYLTDLVAAARVEGARCAALTCEEAETQGVNSRADLAKAEATFQAARRAAAMAGGVTLVAPETVFFSHDTALEADVTVEPNVVFGPGVTVETGVHIAAFCHLEGCTLRRGASVGPFARLRPGADIGAGARIGNFVEVKNAVLGDGAKASHLAYLGDASVGAGANIGAGTITCNYDGQAKHRTAIGQGAFVGSNSTLVAPVEIGQGAYVGAGSVITTAVPADALAIGRARQTTKPGFASRLRARLGLSRH
jgi:bifunctional UDP-N-acetylglucosamine pyrophosphorylase/glucosamine-1-phosphate N-acetyltransferase